MCFKKQIIGWKKVTTLRFYKIKFVNFIFKISIKSIRISNPNHAYDVVVFIPIRMPVSTYYYFTYFNEQRKHDLIAIFLI